jgi:hypothetical protein
MGLVGWLFFVLYKKEIERMDANLLKFLKQNECNVCNVTYAHSFRALIRAHKGGSKKKRGRLDIRLFTYPCHTLSWVGRIGLLAYECRGKYICWNQESKGKTEEKFAK